MLLFLRNAENVFRLFLKRNKMLLSARSAEKCECVIFGKVMEMLLPAVSEEFFFTGRAIFRYGPAPSALPSIKLSAAA